MDDCGEIDAAQATNWLHALTMEADVVVLDLPFSFSAANRAILGASHHLALVLEATPACLRTAALTIEGIRRWDRGPAAVGAVVVRRNEGAPVPPDEIAGELDLPVLQVIPPAPALCLQAERMRAPLIHCDPGALAADSFVMLARRFRSGNSPRSVAT